MGTAKEKKSAPRSGEKRSTALIRPTVATCTRSSRGSPRPAKRRAMCWATGQVAGDELVAHRLATWVVGIERGVLGQQRDEVAVLGVGSGHRGGAPACLSSRMPTVGLPVAPSALSCWRASTCRRGSAAPANRRCRWRRPRPPTPARTCACTSMWSACTRKVHCSIVVRRGDVHERGAGLVDGHPQVGDGVEVEVGARGEVGGDGADRRDQRGGRRRPHLHDGRLTGRVGGWMGVPDRTRCRSPLAACGPRTVILLPPHTGSIGGRQCARRSGQISNNWSDPVISSGRRTARAADTSRSRRSPAWCAARISTARPLEARKVTADRSTTARRTTRRAAAPVRAAGARGQRVDLPSIASSARSGVGSLEVTPSSPGPGVGRGMAGSSNDAHLRQVRWGTGAGAVVAAPERGGCFLNRARPYPDRGDARASGPASTLVRWPGARN